MDRVLIVVGHRKGKTRRITIPVDHPVKYRKGDKVKFDSWTDKGKNEFSLAGRIVAVEEYWQLRPAYSAPGSAEIHTMRRHITEIHVPIKSKKIRK